MKEYLYYYKAYLQIFSNLDSKIIKNVQYY